MRTFIWLVSIVIVVIIGALVLKTRKPALPSVSEPVQQQQQQAPATTQQPATTAPAPTKSATTPTKNGMKIETTKQGTGDPIKVGQTAVVQYEGKLANGSVFDATSLHGGKPFSFTLGQHQVIEGWEEGVLGMKVGETRVLTIPPELAYGPNGYPPVIPGNATLTFTVTLVGIK